MQVLAAHSEVCAMADKLREENVMLEALGM